MLAPWRDGQGTARWGSSAADHRLTATCAAAMTAPARVRGYMSCSRSVPVLATIASARASCISELIFRYSPRMAGTARPGGRWPAPRRGRHPGPPRQGLPDAAERPGPQAFRIATGCVAIHEYYPGGPDEVTAIWATALAQSAPAAPLTAESINGSSRPRLGRSSSRLDPQLASAGTRLAAFGVPRPVTGSQPVVAG